MKSFLFILIFLELVFALMAFTPIFIDRKSAARAFAEWQKNPTSENEAVWSHEAAVSRREGNIADISILILLAANTISLIALIRKIRKPSIS